VHRHQKAMQAEIVLHAGTMKLLKRMRGLGQWWASAFLLSLQQAALTCCHVCQAFAYQQRWYVSLARQQSTCRHAAYMLLQLHLIVSSMQHACFYNYLSAVCSLTRVKFVSSCIMLTGSCITCYDACRASRWL